jgi:ribokinase
MSVNNGAPGIALVIVGHFGFAEDHTPFGNATSLGGSGYACAVGAGAGDSSRVGVVASIGDDFDVAALGKLGVDLRGATPAQGRSPRLTITQHGTDDRSFRSELGVAAAPSDATFPDVYTRARHVHIATMPLHQQAYWLELVRRRSRCRISVDTFEQTALDSADGLRALCYSADTVFMNKKEHDLLFSEHPVPRGELVIKHGAQGAELQFGGRRERIPAPPSLAVDTTGAGEVLAGAFLSLRALNLSVPRALRYAVELASAKVTEFGVDGENLGRALRRVRSEVGQGR